MWSAESGGHDAFTPLVAAVAVGARAAARHRDRAGVHARRAHARVDGREPVQAAPGRFALGIGTSSDVIVERWNGIPFEKPYQRVRDTIRFLRAALTGEKVTEEYETFEVHGFRLGITVPEQPPILVAALREGMLKLAGREGDGAIINWLSADDVKTVVPHVGADKEIVARIFVLPIDDAGLARAVGKRAIASYLTVPVYAAFHDWLGRGDELENLWRLWKEGDRKAAAGLDPRPRRRRAARVGHTRAVPRAHPALHRQRRHDTRARAVLRPRPTPHGARSPQAVTSRCVGSSHRPPKARAQQATRRLRGLQVHVVVAHAARGAAHTSMRTNHHPGSISPRCSAKRADVGAAWWLLCRPSPPVRARATDRSSPSCVRLLAERVADRVDRAGQHHVHHRVDAGGDETDHEQEAEQRHITMTSIAMPTPRPTNAWSKASRSSRSVGMSRRTCARSRWSLGRPSCTARRCRAAPARTRRPWGCAGLRRCRSRRGACGAPRPIRAGRMPVVIQITNRQGNAAPVHGQRPVGEARCR